MNKVPSFNAVSKNYRKAAEEGKSINDLPPLEQLIALYTPSSIFKAWTFRHRLMQVLTEALLTPDNETKAIDFTQRYSSVKDRHKLTNLIQRIRTDE